MELYAPGFFSFDAEGGILHLRCARYGAEALGESGDGVSMAHPYCVAFGQPLEEGIFWGGKF